MLQPFFQIVPSAARNAAGNGEPFDLMKLCEWDASRQFPPMARMQVDVTAFSGSATPTLAVLFEDSIDGTNWNTIGTTGNLTLVIRTVINIGIRGDAYPANFAWPFNARRFRARWTIVGTNPSFTFSVKGLLL